MTDTTDQDTATQANTDLRALAQELRHTQNALLEANANAAAWQARANTLEQVIAAHHDTLEAQRAHLDMVTSAWSRDLRRLEAYETPPLTHTGLLPTGADLGLLAAIPDGRDD